MGQAEDLGGAHPAEQREILNQRGVLSPDEIHRLASKTKSAMGAAGQKAACHSDVADDTAAQHLQSERLDPLTLEPLEPIEDARA